MGGHLLLRGTVGSLPARITSYSAPRPDSTAPELSKRNNMMSRTIGTRDSPWIRPYHLIQALLKTGTRCRP